MRKNGELWFVLAGGVRVAPGVINVNEFNAEGLFADSSESQAVCSLLWIMDAGEFVLVQILRQIMYKHGLHTGSMFEYRVLYMRSLSWRKIFIEVSAAPPEILPKLKEFGSWQMERYVHLVDVRYWYTYTVVRIALYHIPEFYYLSLSPEDQISTFYKFTTV